MDQSLYWVLNINLSKCMVLTKNSSFVNIFIYVYFINFLLYLCFLKSQTDVILLWMNRYHSNSICTIYCSSFYLFCNIKYFLTVNFEIFLCFIFSFPFGTWLKFIYFHICNSSLVKTRPNNSRFG